MGWGTGARAWVVAWNTAPVAQTVTITVAPDGGIVRTWTETLRPHGRWSLPMHERVGEGAFATRVVFPAGLGVATVAQWAKGMTAMGYPPMPWRCEP